MLTIPDARVLARKADGVVLVVRADSTTRSSVKAALNRLADDGTVVIGTILNDWKPKTNNYGSYYRTFHGA
jgi:Mrp family chromosome partitioning ATPase